MPTKLKPKVEKNKVSRRERKKQELREAIYNVAVKLFSRKGFDKVTIKDITNKVDILKATFFNYFSSKEAILPHFLSQPSVSI